MSCPFVETVVFMRGKITSYLSKVNTNGLPAVAGASGLSVRTVAALATQGNCSRVAGDPVQVQPSAIVVGWRRKHLSTSGPLYGWTIHGVTIRSPWSLTVIFI